MKSYRFQLLSIAVCVLVAGHLSLAQNSGAPYSTARFRIVFENVAEFPVTAVKGLVSESIVNYEVEASLMSPQKDLRPVEIIVTRAAVPPDGLYDWRKEILRGRRDMRKGRVDLLNASGEPLLTWEIVDAWPSKWEWPDLDGSNVGPALEVIHFTCREVSPAGEGVMPLPTLVLPKIYRK